MVRCIPMLLKSCIFARQLQRNAVSIASFASKVPQQPYFRKIEDSELPPKTEIDLEMINRLERLSLVDFANQQGIQRLEAAIRFADQLCVVDTTNVESMYTVLEDRNLYLRKDEVTEGNTREEILANAAKLEDEYFVAPPGNIPLIPKTEKYGSKVS